MSVSRPAVHPLEPPPLTDGAVVVPPPRLRVKDVQGMPGTSLGLSLRLCQFIFAAISLCVMATTSDFLSVTAFCYLVAAVSLQSLWSLVLAVVDIYALSVKRSLRNPCVVSLFTIGDGVSSCSSLIISTEFAAVLLNLIHKARVSLLFVDYIYPTFAAACSSAGITVLIGNDLDRCNMNHCKRFMSATAMAFLSWFAVSPSFFLEFLVIGFQITFTQERVYQPARVVFADSLLFFLQFYAP